MKPEEIYNGIKVLDKGFVRLVDVMGNDHAIVQAARVSYGEGTKTVSEDHALINYLLEHHHTSPFEQVEFKFHCKMPIFVARQWVRHRTASLNEMSGRYSIMKDECYLPELENIQYQSSSNKQGREGIVDEYIGTATLGVLERSQEAAFRDYGVLISSGISRELSRINLPLSTYTEWYWKMDLNNLFKFLFLRMDSHAQWEIRQYANAIAEIVKCICPFAYEAYEEYMFHAVKFSRTEMSILKSLLDVDEEAITDGVVEKLGKRRAMEFAKKLGIME